MIGSAKRLLLRVCSYKRLRAVLVTCGFGLVALALFSYTHPTTKTPTPEKDLIVTTTTTKPPTTTTKTTKPPKKSTHTTPKPPVTKPVVVSKPVVAPKATHKKIVPKVVVPSPSSSVRKLKPTTNPSSSGSSGSGSGSNSSGSSGSSGSSSSGSQPVSYTSSNWSGYLASGGTFTGISGSWTTPDPSGNNSATSADATWIGIGGITSEDLIQIGTTDEVSPSGQVATEAFYELLPGASISIPNVTITPGDVVTASISQITTGEWTITLTDQTNDQTFTDTVFYTSSYSSAEWIEEDPSYTADHLVPFDDFGSVTFNNASDTVNGATQTISTSGPGIITMLNNSGGDEAIPTALNGAGNGFTVNWSNGGGRP